EDLPLNVSRESVQSNRVMGLLKKLVMGKALDILAALGKEDPEKYADFWEVYGDRLKEGVAIEQEEPEKLFPLLRFHTDQDLTGWVSLAEYLEKVGEDQKEIYYFLSEDRSAVRYSPHMDSFRKAEIPVLVLADPVDPFVLLRLKEFDGHPLVNVADADLPEPEKSEDEPELPVMDDQIVAGLIERVRSELGDKVSDVRTTDRLSDSPARLVDAEGAMEQSVQRVYQMMDKTFEIPKKVLELNPRHPIIEGLAGLSEGDPRFGLIATQIYEDSLLVEGLHPDPVSMVARIQELMAAVLKETKES
ncbi:MAG: molecular chaperone HtpG, partial [Anaerolineaceae bacterium]|nr:molecular chaperone HtpG [Anaerolineaceae bacterium]